MIGALKRHLAARKIAPILNVLKEKKEQNSELALKPLCVFDYAMEKNKLYTPTMVRQPKYIKQLMSFKSYNIMITVSLKSYPKLSVNAF